MDGKRGLVSWAGQEETLAALGLGVTITKLIDYEFPVFFNSSFARIREMESMTVST
jgi:hypothetical protein